MGLREMRNGIMPKADRIIHVSEVSRIASRRPISWLCGLRRTRKMPMPKVMPMEMMKPHSEPSR